MQVGRADADRAIGKRREWLLLDDDVRLIPRELPAERLMQQRLLQRVEGGELLLVEGLETLGFGRFERADP